MRGRCGASSSPQQVTRTGSGAAAAFSHVSETGRRRMDRAEVLRLVEKPSASCVCKLCFLLHYVARYVSYVFAAAIGCPLSVCGSHPSPTSESDRFIPSCRKA